MLYIIYDGNCTFCTNFANWANKKNNCLDIISVREQSARILLKKNGITFVNLQTIYFIDSENVFIRSKAIFKIMSYLNYPWKLISYFKILPTFLTDWGYKLFAKYRNFFVTI